MAGWEDCWLMEKDCCDDDCDGCEAAPAGAAPIWGGCMLLKLVDGEGFMLPMGDCAVSGGPPERDARRLRADAAVVTVVEAMGLALGELSQSI